MSDINSEMLFEYSEYDEDEDQMEYDVSDMDNDVEGDAFSSNSFESESSPDAIFEPNGSSSHTSDSRAVIEAGKVGYNGTPYQTWTLEQFIESHFLTALKRLSNVQLGKCTTSDLLIMLQTKRWQLDEVLDAFFTNEQKFLKECGLPTTQPSNNKFTTEKDFTCIICCETYPTTKVYSTTCNHKYCIECYNQYVANEINSGKLITCMEPECSLTIPHQDIDRILQWTTSSGSTGNTGSTGSNGSNNNSKEVNFMFAEKSERSIKENPLVLSHARSMVNSKNCYKWCPATDCISFTELVSSNRLYYADDDNQNGEEDNQSGDDTRRKQVSLQQNKYSIDISLVPIVGCSEQHEFCFNCNYENHLPCPCWLVKKWIKKCADDSETAHWLDANTHGCPKCSTSIEKNGGCNHMTCRKCSYEFCWICLGDWSSHKNNYSCNRFRDERAEEESRKNKSKATLERYLHFYKRYSIHESSMKGDQKTLKRIDNVTKLYMEDMRSKGERNLSWNDIQFLPDAMRALQNGRKTLKWTYCFAFYLNRLNFSEIFETNQDFLNKTVEDLSNVFEKIIEIDQPDKVGIILKKKMNIINLGELVNSRRKTLIKAAEENLATGLLSLDKDL